MGVAQNLLRLLLMSRVGLWCCWLWSTFIDMLNQWLYPKSRSIRTKSSEDGLDNRTRNEWGDFDTGYDSTWEDDNDKTESDGSDGNDENSEESQRSVYRLRHRAERNEYAAKDMQNFRHMLRKVNEKTIVNIEDRQKTLPNLLFYQNKKHSVPDGMLIEKFHVEWFGDYQKLECTHSFIQWLFPIQEKGMNWDSYVLTEEEIMLFREDEDVKKRLVKSYKLMLDFYGIQLLDEKTGKVRRIKRKWKERFEKLNRNTHNNLRITRILKCLGILGFQHYQAPLVKFFLHQTLVKERLPRVKQSALDYFLFSVVDKEQRRKLIKYAFQNFQPREEFVWCPKRIQRRFLKEIKQKNAEDTDSDLSEPEKESEARKRQLENKGASFNLTNRRVGTRYDAGFGRNDQKSESADTATSPHTTAGCAKASDQRLEDDDSQIKESQNGGYKNNANDLPAESGVTDASSQTGDISGKNSAKDKDLDKVSENQKIDYVKVTVDVNTIGDGALAQELPPNRNDGTHSETMPVIQEGTDTTRLEDTKMSGQSSAGEPDGMSDNHESKQEDTDKPNIIHMEIEEDNTQLRPNIVSSNPDNKANSSEKGSIIMSEDQRVQESSATEEQKGTTGGDALALSTSSSEDLVGSAMELSEGEPDRAQNTPPNGDDGTHSKAMPVIQEGTDTTRLEDTKMSGQSSAGEPDGMSDNHESKLEDTDKPNIIHMEIEEDNTQLRPNIVSSNPGDKDKSSEEDLVIMSEDQKVQESTATEEQKGTTGGDALALSTSSSEDVVGSAMEWSEGDQRRDKEQPNRDDADAMKFSETEGDTDKAQNIQPNEDDETHSGANPLLQDGPDTTPLDDSEMPTTPNGDDGTPSKAIPVLQSSAVGTNEMSDNQKNDQGCFKEKPNKDEDEDEAEMN